MITQCTVMSTTFFFENPVGKYMDTFKYILREDIANCHNNHFEVTSSFTELRSYLVSLPAGNKSNITALVFI